MNEAGATERRTRARALRWLCAGALSLAAHLVALVLLIQTPDGVRPLPTQSVEVTLFRPDEPEPETQGPSSNTSVVAAATAAPTQTAAEPALLPAPAVIAPAPSAVPVPGAPRRAEAQATPTPPLKLSCADITLLPVSLRPMVPCEKLIFPRAGSLDRQIFALTPRSEDDLVLARKAARRQDPRLSPQGKIKAAGPCQGDNLGIGCPPELPLVLVHAGGAPINAADVPPPLIGK